MNGTCGGHPQDLALLVSLLVLGVGLTAFVTLVMLGRTSAIGPPDRVRRGFLLILRHTIALAGAGGLPLLLRAIFGEVSEASPAAIAVSSVVLAIFLIGQQVYTALWRQTPATAVAPESARRFHVVGSWAVGLLMIVNAVLESVALYAVGAGWLVVVITGQTLVLSWRAYASWAGQKDLSFAGPSTEVRGVVRLGSHVSFRQSLLITSVVGVVLAITSYGIGVRTDALTTPGLWAGVSVLAGVTFLGSGLLLWSRNRRNPTGRLVAMTGASWLVATWAGSDSEAAFTIGATALYLTAPITFHLLMAFPHGHLAGRPRGRLLVLVGYATSIALGGASLLVDRAPAPLAKRCLEDADRNLLLGLAGPTSGDVIPYARNVTGAVLTLCLLVVLVHRATVTRSRARGSIRIIAAGASGMLIPFAIFLIGDVVAPNSETPPAFAWLSLFAFAFIPYLILLGTARTFPRPLELLPVPPDRPSLAPEVVATGTPDGREDGDRLAELRRLDDTQLIVFGLYLNHHLRNVEQAAILVVSPGTVGRRLGEIAKTLGLPGTKGRARRVAADAYRDAFPSALELRPKAADRWRVAVGSLPKPDASGDEEGMARE